MTEKLQRKTANLVLKIVTSFTNAWPRSTNWHQCKKIISSMALNKQKVESENERFDLGLAVI